MKRHAFFAAVLAASLAWPCHAGGARHPGENLLQPLPLPEGPWKSTPSTQAKADIVDWRMAGDKDNSARTMINHDAGGKPAAGFRESNLGAGRRSCRAFGLKPLEASAVNGFERELFVDTCQRADGQWVTVLWLYIAGRDAGYSMHRKWMGVPDQAAIDRWVGYLKSVSVCDTRKRRKAPCPASP